MSTNNITTVREHLLATLAELRNRDTPMEIDRARAVADVARVLVDSAKVEVAYLQVTNQHNADFFDRPAAAPEASPVLPDKAPAPKTEPLPNGIAGITRHLLK